MVNKCAYTYIYQFPLKVQSGAGPSAFCQSEISSQGCLYIWMRAFTSKRTDVDCGYKTARLRPSVLWANKLTTPSGMNSFSQTRCPFCGWKSWFRWQRRWEDPYKIFEPGWLCESRIEIEWNWISLIFVRVWQDGKAAAKNAFLRFPNLTREVVLVDQHTIPCVDEAWRPCAQKLYWQISVMTAHIKLTHTQRQTHSQTHTRIKIRAHTYTHTHSLSHTHTHTHSTAYWITHIKLTHTQKQADSQTHTHTAILNEWFFLIRISVYYHTKVVRRIHCG